jgi:cytochrome oxidase Cu insertion factor (SCO1/SenC/PrrC family)
MKKFWVLFGLFILPLVFYIFLLTGTNNFAKLPVLTEKVSDVTHLASQDADTISLEGKINILCFFGDDLQKVKNNAFNLNEKIYKHFYKFKDFQFVVVLPNGTEDQAENLKKELGFITDMQKWRFMYGTPEEISELFDSLQTTYRLNANSYSPYAFIIDKNMDLRGRTSDEDSVESLMYGYNAETVAPIHKKMVDDVKVLVAEYRLALKKNKREI